MLTKEILMSAKHQRQDYECVEVLYMISVSEAQLKMNTAFLWLREALCCKLVSKGD